MRLLKLDDNGEFSLIEFFSGIPPYATLSHTWGADGEEVTYRDLVEGTGKNKAGYQKIWFCKKQAVSDGLQYFWIDTCCIDKSSSAELSEAINSMFRWYHDAVKCYVYLSDVSIQNWGSTFQRSRWFTRGWTLQELIAPASVEFFSAEGEWFGDKKSLEEVIEWITGITTQALQGRPLSKFSIDERTSWAEKRETKREEDAVYSLLGIFDIYMPLIYGEGRRRALIRLNKEIKESLNDASPALSTALFSEKKNPFKADDASSTVPYELNSCFYGRGFQHTKQEEKPFDRGQFSLGAAQKRALVLYDYERSEDNEINLVRGEYITEIKQLDKGWWVGINSKGRRGLFPDSHVELVEDEKQLSHQPAYHTAALTASAVNTQPGSEPALSYSKLTGPTATALFNYAASANDELSFSKGDKITGLAYSENDWLFGFAPDGRSGLVPSNYVELDRKR